MKVYMLSELYLFLMFFNTDSSFICFISIMSSMVSSSPSDASSSSSRCGMIGSAFFTTIFFSIGGGSALLLFCFLLSFLSRCNGLSSWTSFLRSFFGDLGEGGDLGEVERGERFPSGYEELEVSSIIFFC